MNQFLANSNLKLAAYFKLRECLIRHRANLRESEQIFLINSSKRQLELTSLNQQESYKVELNWELFIEQIAPRGLTKREFDLLLRGGFNLANLEDSLLNPKLDMRPFYQRLSQFLAQKLMLLGLKQGSCVIITGFLTTFKGIKTFMKREFELELVTTVSAAASSLNELNASLNTAIRHARLKKSNTSDTGEYAISLKRSRRMLE